MHTALGAYSKYSSGAYLNAQFSEAYSLHALGAVYIKIVLLEHIGLRMFPDYCAPGAFAPKASALGA